MDWLLASTSVPNWVLAVGIISLASGVIGAIARLSSLSRGDRM